MIGMTPTTKTLIRMLSHPSRTYMTLWPNTSDPDIALCLLLPTKCSLSYSKGSVRLRPRLRV